MTQALLAARAGRECTRRLSCVGSPHLISASAILLDLRHRRVTKPHANEPNDAKRVVFSGRAPNGFPELLRGRTYAIGGADGRTTPSTAAVTDGERNHSSLSHERGLQAGRNLDLSEDNSFSTLITASAARE
jgi:hypothetical protein